LEELDERPDEMSEETADAIIKEMTLKTPQIVPRSNKQ